MRPNALLLLAAVTLAACSGGGGGDDATATTSRSGGCPVAADTVADAVGHAVTIDTRTRTSGSCTYVGNGDEVTGARVEVQRRSLTDEPYADVLERVERQSGPAVELPDGRVDGASRGWIVTVGRSVQLGAARVDALVIVAVTDPSLGASAAEHAAAEIAEAALASASDGE